MITGLPPGVTAPPGFPTTLPDEPDVTIRKWIAAKRHIVLESGLTKTVGGHDVAWAATKYEMGGLQLRRIIGYVFTGTGLFEVNYRCIAVDFDALRPMFMESLRSLSEDKR